MTQEAILKAAIKGKVKFFEGYNLEMPPNQPKEQKEQKEEEESGGEMIPVEKILWSSPPWTELGAGDLLERRKVGQQLEELLCYDLLTIRDGMASYMQRAKDSSERYSVKQMGRLFVLNRFLFAVPEEVPLGSIPFFGGWDVPVKQGVVNPCWPWSCSQIRQKLYLTGLFSGYCGDQFLALEEFDYFRERFGRRDHRAAYKHKTKSATLQTNLPAYV